MHTYGRQLNQHPHIHLSVTRGGLTQYDTWKPIFFKKKDVEKVWRSAVIRLLRDNYAQFQRYWKLHFAKKTRGVWHNVKYLGRYLKRPPISASQLKHYSGSTAVHHYYDHHGQQYRRQALSQEEMIRRYVSHIPARHFKMIRYYGFLANHKRGGLLPKVYDALDMIHPNVPEKPGFAALIKGFLNTDPYQCILCGNRLRFMSTEKGLHAVTLLSERRDKMAKKRWLQTAA
ncbi:transposase [Providencia alcalifaciens]